MPDRLFRYADIYDLNGLKLIYVSQPWYTDCDYSDLDDEDHIFIEWESLRRHKFDPAQFDKYKVLEKDEVVAKLKINEYEERGTKRINEHIAKQKKAKLEQDLEEEEEDLEEDNSEDDAKPLQKVNISKLMSSALSGWAAEMDSYENNILNEIDSAVRLRTLAKRLISIEKNIKDLESEKNSTLETIDLVINKSKEILNSGQISEVKRYLKNHPLVLEKF